MDVGRPAEIRCNVDAVPLTDTTITWRREGYDLGRYLVDTKSQLSHSGELPSR